MRWNDGEIPWRQAPDLNALANWLLDAASRGEFEAALGRARADIEAWQDDLAPIDRFRCRLLLFDVAQISANDPSLLQEVAAELLSATIEAGAPGWEAVRYSSRQHAIERLARETRSGIELLELMTYAPDAGLRSFGLSYIETEGMRELERGEDSRSHERLLHAVGASEGAYRLEARRKQRQFTDAIRGSDVVLESGATGPRVVAIAGGHAQLRTTAAALLQRHEVRVVPIPSSREAVRRERNVQHLMQGCDLAILLVRQITHSTSDQVRKAAEKLGVPVLYSNALSAGAIERQLFERDA